MKKKLANRSDRQPKNRVSRGRRRWAQGAATIKRGMSAQERRTHIRALIRAQHRAAVASISHELVSYALVEERVAALIRAAGGPQYAPLTTYDPVPPAYHDQLLTCMPRSLVDRIETPPEEWAGLQHETIIRLAVEEWKAQQHTFVLEHK